MSACKQAQPLVNFPGGLPGGLNMAPLFRRDKVVIVVGATGTGKSRLAIDLATRFHAEIVNSDKMQVYKGLDIVTNKVTEEECRGVPHHLLGTIDPHSNFTAEDFCHQALSIMESITSRDRLPIIADVSLPVLHSFVSERVDRMVEAGLVEEVRRLFDPEADYSRGIRRAIGVPELDQYLRVGVKADERTRARLLKIAISKIKENTCLLAWRQLQKIQRLQNQCEWDMHRLDATGVFLNRGKGADEAWNKLVAEPSSNIVRKFLYKDCVPNIVSHEVAVAAATAMIGAPVPMTAVATACR
ncbi:hypothetical protein CMV_017484 [Castanea mollissima]|uniref:Uncharacterized protein n=1 Tax=Castanea mollissima TaxID=60419 RepID=A0A8J4QSN3_9ROSI|nr:hypothetical protein CMV_017484 [Castanea mollissima]